MPRGTPYAQIGRPLGRKRIISTAVDPELIDALQAIAVAGERTFSAEVRRAIRRHVENSEAPVEAEASQDTSQSARDGSAR